MQHFNPEHIARLLRTALPGQRSHLKMIPPGRRLLSQVEHPNNVRNSSVLLLLFKQNGKLYTCLTKRSPGMKNHPGQISLPGGKIEAGESPEVAALREAQEEVGIDPAGVLLLGRLSEVYVQVSGYKIYPLVGWMDYQPDFVLNPDEAERVVLFPLEVAWLDQQIKNYPVQTSTGLLNVPCFEFDDEVIWGATAMILAEFLDLLNQPVFTMSQ